MRAAASTRALRLHAAIRLRESAPRRPQHLNGRPLSAAAGQAAAVARHRVAAAAAAGRQPARRLCVAVSARRSRDEFNRGDDYVAFDDEEDWEQQGSPLQAPGLGPILSTALRGVTVIADKLANVAMQVAPADASPAVVRVAVNAGLVLLALSFVKSILSFFLTLGTIILGAYVAVRVFGIDVSGVTGSLSDSGSSGKAKGSGGSGSLRPKSGGKRRPDSRAPQSEFKGVLGGGSSKDEDGLLDVWFQRSKGGSEGDSKQKDKRRR